MAARESQDDDPAMQDGTPPTQFVRSVLASAGLHPTDAEADKLAWAYPAYRAAIDRLYRIEAPWVTTPPVPLPVDEP